jgi:hypothetical protein
MFSFVKEKYVQWKQHALPIEVFVRHCHYSSVSAHKKRFPHFTKECCFQNLIETLKGDPKVNVTFFLDTFHPAAEQHFILKQTDFPVVEIKAGSEAGSFLFMLEYVLKKNFTTDPLIYFLEDDYLHKAGWPTVLREAFTLPGVDYATLYDHRDKYFLEAYRDLHSKIYHTASCHWRTTPSTTNTYAMKFSTLKKHAPFHRAFSLGRTITSDHDKFCKLNAEGAQLISSLPGWATHCEPEFASPCTDWNIIR